MSLFEGKFEFTPFDVALRETVNWLVDHYDTDARIGRRSHSGAANGKKKNETAAHVERVGAEAIEVE